MRNKHIIKYHELSSEDFIIELSNAVKASENNNRVVDVGGVERPEAPSDDMEELNKVISSNEEISRVEQVKIIHRLEEEMQKESPLKKKNASELLDKLQRREGDITVENYKKIDKVKNENGLPLHEQIIDAVMQGRFKDADFGAKEILSAIAGLIGFGLTVFTFAETYSLPISILALVNPVSWWYATYNVYGKRLIMIPLIWIFLPVLLGVIFDDMSNSRIEESYALSGIISPILVILVGYLYNYIGIKIGKRSRL